MECLAEVSTCSFVSVRGLLRVVVQVTKWTYYLSSDVGCPMTNCLGSALEFVVADVNVYS